MDAISPDRKSQTVRLPDGGYFGMLHAYHELHCLVSVIGVKFPACLPWYTAI